MAKVKLSYEDMVDVLKEKKAIGEGDAAGFKEMLKLKDAAPSVYALAINSITQAYKDVQKHSTGEASETYDKSKTASQKEEDSAREAARADKKRRDERVAKAYALSQDKAAVTKELVRNRNAKAVAADLLTELTGKKATPAMTPADIVNTLVKEVGEETAYSELAGALDVGYKGGVITALKSKEEELGKDKAYSEVNRDLSRIDTQLTRNVAASAAKKLGVPAKLPMQGTEVAVVVNLENEEQMSEEKFPVTLIYKTSGAEKGGTESHVNYTFDSVADFIDFKKNVNKFAGTTGNPIQIYTNYPESMGKAVKGSKQLQQYIHGIVTDDWTGTELGDKIMLRIADEEAAHEAQAEKEAGIRKEAQDENERNRIRHDAIMASIKKAFGNVSDKDIELYDKAKQDAIARRQEAAKAKMEKWREVSAQNAEKGRAVARQMLVNYLESLEDKTPTERSDMLNNFFNGRDFSKYAKFFNAGDPAFQMLAGEYMLPKLNKTIGDLTTATTDFKKLRDKRISDVKRDLERVKRSIESDTVTSNDKKREQLEQAERVAAQQIADIETEWQEQEAEQSQLFPGIDKGEFEGALGTAKSLRDRVSDLVNRTTSHIETMKSMNPWTRRKEKINEAIGKLNDQVDKYIRTNIQEIPEDATPEEIEDIKKHNAIIRKQADEKYIDALGDLQNKFAEAEAEEAAYDPGKNKMFNIRTGTYLNDWDRYANMTNEELYNLANKSDLQIDTEASDDEDQRNKHLAARQAARERLMLHNLVSGKGGFGRNSQALLFPNATLPDGTKPAGGWYFDPNKVNPATGEKGSWIARLGKVRDKGEKPLEALTPAEKAAMAGVVYDDNTGEIIGGGADYETAREIANAAVRNKKDLRAKEQIAKDIGVDVNDLDEATTLTEEEKAKYDQGIVDTPEDIERKAVAAARRKKYNANLREEGKTGEFTKIFNERMRPMYNAWKMLKDKAENGTMTPADKLQWDTLSGLTEDDFYVVNHEADYNAKYAGTENMDTSEHEAGFGGKAGHKAALDRKAIDKIRAVVNSNGSVTLSGEAKKRYNNTCQNVGKAFGIPGKAIKDVLSEGEFAKLYADAYDKENGNTYDPLIKRISDLPAVKKVTAAAKKQKRITDAVSDTPPGFGYNEPVATSTDTAYDDGDNTDDEREDNLD